MTAPAPHAPRSTRRRLGGALLLLSVAGHALVLAALALHMPRTPVAASFPAMQVSLVRGPPLARAQPAPSTAPARPTPARVVRLDAAPRYASASRAPIGEATDAVDLFGPVFADGLWPRPVRVRSEPCDPDQPQRADGCRRDLMMIGLASTPPARSNAAR